MKRIFSIVAKLPMIVAMLLLVGLLISWKVYPDSAVVIWRMQSRNVPIPKNRPVPHLQFIALAGGKIVFGEHLYREHYDEMESERKVLLREWDTSANSDWPTAPSAQRELELQFLTLRREHFIQENEFYTRRGIFAGRAPRPMARMIASGFGEKPRWQKAGASYEASRGKFLTIQRLVIPFWAVAAVLVVLPLRRIFRSVRRLLRVRRNQCPVCGYDLRESRERCPECGRVNTQPTRVTFLRATSRGGI